VSGTMPAMRRLTAALTLAVTSVLLLAPAALAHDGGMGTYGEADDKVVTNAGFIMIAFFPLFILACSLIQWSLEKRKDRRKAARKALAREDAVRGGW
jgi:hypothetical protein